MVDITSCIPSCAITSEYMSWTQIIGVLIAAVFLILSILYMLGRVMNKKEWEALAKLEIYNTIIALVWVLIIYVVTASSCSIACQMSGGDNPFDVAVSFLKNTQANIESHITQLLDTARTIRINSAVMVTIPPSGTMVRPLDGCNFIANNFEQMGLMMTPFIGSLIVQQVSLWMIYKIAFLLLLPIGVILRIIPFARESGAFLMALALSLYIVMPLMYVFSAKAIDGVTASYPVDMRGPSTSGLLGVVDTCDSSDVASITLVSIGYMLPSAVFIPGLVMIVTMGAARVLSKVLQYDFK